MSNSLCMLRSRHLDKKLNQLVESYNLDLCYQDKSEKIFKSEDLLISLKRKYIFLYPLSDDDTLLPEIKHFFRI